MKDAEQSSDILKEVGTVYGIVLAIIVVGAVIAPFVGVLGQFLYALVAFLFYFVPHKLIEKREWDYESFGIHNNDRAKGVMWGAIATVITIPFFMGGMWVWETYALKRTFKPDAERYRQFSATLDGKPKSWGQGAGVWVWSDGPDLHVGVSNDGKANNRVRISSSTPFSVTKRGALSINTHTQRGATLVLTHSKARGSAVLRGADDVSVTIEPVVSENEKWNLFVGPTAEKQDTFNESRGYLWLLLWIATQLLLVAFPEEYFYRGYIQTRLKRAFHLRREEGKKMWVGAFIFTPSIIFTSLLFGIGHLIVPVGGAVFATRMTVLFPSLIFGWLRDHTGSILASTIYHTCCNLMVLLAAVHFV